MRKYFFTLFTLNLVLISTAQLPVKDEPRHHNVFENEFVRILDVHLAPKDTTLYHLHNTPSVFIIFTNTNVGSQLAGKQPEKGVNLPGTISFDSLATPRLHRVWNEDTEWFHVMDVELTINQNPVEITPLKDPSLQLLFNQKLLNGYKFQLKPRSQIHLPSSINGYLVVSLNEGIADYFINVAAHRRMLKAGHYIWVDAGSDFSIKSLNSQAIDFAVLQLK